MAKFTYSTEKDIISRLKKLALEFEVDARDILDVALLELFDRDIDNLLKKHGFNVL